MFSLDFFVDGVESEAERFIITTTIRASSYRGNHLSLLDAHKALETKMNPTYPQNLPIWPEPLVVSLLHVVTV